MPGGKIHGRAAESRWPGSIPGRHALVAAIWLIVAARVGSEFTGRGFRYWHLDLADFFHEQATFYRGTYPHSGVARPVPEIGGVHTDYPPYSFWLMAAWVPPGLGWPLEQFWFCACQGAATAVLVGFAWCRGREVGRGAAWLLAGSVAAMTGLRADLLFGNFGALMAAMLVGLYWSLETGRWRIAGAAWLAGIMKPQMGWLFAWLFLSSKGWRALVGALVALALLTSATCWWTGVAPMAIVHSGYSDRLLGMVAMPERHSLPSLLVAWGAAPKGALVAGAGLGMCAVGLALQGRLSLAPALSRFAFVALVGRICTYHNACDDLLLVFTLAFFGKRAWRTHAAADWASFLALGATVWVPTAASGSVAAAALLVAVWAVLAFRIAYLKHEPLAGC